MSFLNSSEGSDRAKLAAVGHDNWRRRAALRSHAIDVTDPGDGIAQSREKFKVGSIPVARSFIWPRLFRTILSTLVVLQSRRPLF